VCLVDIESNNIDAKFQYRYGRCSNYMLNSCQKEMLGLTVYSGKPLKEVFAFTVLFSMENVISAADKNI